MKENSEIGFIGANSQILQFPAVDAQTSRAFHKATKIGVFKELHKKGLLSDCELAALIAKQDKLC